MHSSCCKVAMFLGLWLGAGFSPMNVQAATSTHSFSNKTRGSHPSTVTYGSNKVTVDLSALPANTQVFRAVFVPHRAGNIGGGAYGNLPLRVEASDAPGVWLDTQGPRHMNIDCTAAVQRALARTPRQLVLNLVSFGGVSSTNELRLDVWCDQPVVNSIQQVTNAQAVHIAGDTMITFTEVDTPITDPNTIGSTFRTVVAALDATNEIRYRIYRSATPIDDTTIRTAELVDEIQPLSGWNEEYYGYERNSQWSNLVVPRLPIAHMTQADVGTGIYVRRAQAAQSAYYAVSRSVNGEEDLTTWTVGGNCAAAAVSENAGPGLVFHWKTETPANLTYVNNPTVHYYVRWECPPDTCNIPNTPHNYLVAVPPTAADPRPVNISLHGWGSWFVGASGWWYEAESAGSLLLTTNQLPYDWWTAYHDNYGTIRPFTTVDGNAGGVVRNYTENRILSFLDNYVKTHWNVDDNHIILGGVSMGGSGSSMWGQRANDRFAYIDSWVGVHIPLLSPTFMSSFRGVFGPSDWACEYLDTGLSAWDYWDTDQWLRAHVAADTPYISFSNGKNDSSIGWYQAWLHLQALIETRRPFNFAWGQSGHNQRAILPGPNRSDRYIGVDIDRNKTLPAFTHCSLDGNPGNGEVTVGDDAGQINGYMLWEPAGSVDTADTWEMTCLLIAAAPQASCTVDITPRRCQAFKPAVGKVCNWTNTDVATGTVLASGTVTVDQYGLVTIPQTIVSKTKNRIAITVSNLVGDINGDGYVNVGDLQALVAAWASQQTPPSANWNADADLNSDGYVNVGDLQLLVANWGASAN